MLNVAYLTCPCAKCQALPVEKRQQPDETLVKLLRSLDEQIAQDYPGIVEGITITSCVRCPEHNAAIGGAADSQHVHGFAADISAPTSELRYAIVERATGYAVRFIEVCPRHVHVDLRPGPLRLIIGADE
jgi:uncharacterized protein YcbK (DUF882 family)